MKLQPFREETLRDANAMRVRLNEMVRSLNASVPGIAVARVPNVQQGMTVQLASPGFNVGAIFVGGVWPTNSGAVPTAAPWAKDWAQQTDGSIILTIGGLTTANTTYAVSLVLVEGTS